MFIPFISHRLDLLKRYRTYFETAESSGLIAMEAGEATDAARKLHGAIYLERGYVSVDELEHDGSITLPADPHRNNSHYFIARPIDTHHPVAVARLINATADRGFDSFQTWTDITIDAAGRARLQQYSPSEVAEVSALVKAKGTSTVSVLLLYRQMWQYSLSHGIELWMMSCDADLLRRLRRMFGNAVQPIGAPQYYKGHTVVPAVIEIPGSLDYVRRMGRRFSSRGSLGRAVSKFFLSGLASELQPVPHAWIVDRLWHWYGYTYDGLRSFWPYTHLISLVTKTLKAKDGETIVELGCGTGSVLELVLKEPGVQAIGIDRSTSMLGVARKKLAGPIASGRLELTHQDLLSWLVARADNSVDAIVSVNVFYAIADQSRLWQEMARVVKPTGRIVGTTSVETGSGPIIKEHFEHDHWWRLVTPKLLSVFVIDALINALGRHGAFAFADEPTLQHAAEAAGGTWTNLGRCYGGPEAGVNILFHVTIPT